MLMDQGARDHGHPPLDGAIPVQITNWWCLQFNAEDILELGSESLKHAVLELENLGRETRKDIYKKEKEYGHE
jgi:hypothetical protein